MNLRRLALSNVRQSRGRYLAYLGSAAFAVAIYFLYTALTYHPDLQEGFQGARYVSAATHAAAVVIAAFTFLFLLYSGSAFVRFRMKEFGLLALLGFTRGQLVRMILWENLIVAAMALAIGLGAGLLFLKLFFMAISALLRLPAELSFYAGRPVWIQTIAVFGSFFVVVSLTSLRGVLRRSVVQLLRARREPKGTPSSSRPRAAAGLILVALGYAWASVPAPMAVVVGVIPVTAIVSLGTYLLLREGSIALLHWLRRRKRLFYRPTPFLIVSQLIYKLQDNYRVLAAVSLLIAVILSAVGTIYALFVVVADDVESYMPQAIQLVLEPGGEGIAAVREALSRHGVQGLAQVEVTLLAATLDGEKVYLVPQAVYQSLYRPRGELMRLESADQAILVHPFIGRPAARQASSPGERPAAGGELQLLEVGGEALPLEVVADESGRLFNGALGLTKVLVLGDALYARIAAAYPAIERIELATWTGAAWRGRAMESALAELRARIGSGDALTATLAAFHGAMSSFGLALFIGIFVSLVFFAATCSLLYFRLFTEIDDDRRYFRQLYQLGLDAPDIRRLSRMQNAAVFLVPFAVGLIHSTFAMKAFSTLVMRPVLAEGWMVALAYLVVYALCFALSNGVYQRAVAARW